MRSGEKWPLSFREPSVMRTDGGVHLMLYCLEQRKWHIRLAPQRFHTRERQGKLPSAQMLQHGTKGIMASEHHLGMNEKSLQRPRAKTILFQPLFFNSQFFTSSTLQTKKLPRVGGFTYSPDVSGFKKCNPKMMGCQAQKRTVIPRLSVPRILWGEFVAKSRSFCLTKSFGYNFNKNHAGIFVAPESCLG